MTAKDLIRFRDALAAKEAELVARSLKRRSEIAVERVADAADEGREAAEREFAIRNLDHEARLLRSVRAALQRLDDDAFGTCAACDEAISLKRLAAVPWAEYCVACQDQADHRAAAAGAGVEVDEAA